MDTTYLQRRYLVSFEARRLPHIFTDVLVIGSGLAGMRAALAAAETAEVIIASKRKAEDSNTWHAQGGLAAAMADTDSPEKHIADTLAAAAGLADEEIVRTVIEQAPQHIRELQQWGVDFDMEGDRLQLGREGAHSDNRVVHAHGDATGQTVARSVLGRVAANENIKLFDNCFAIDLITDPPEAGPGAACVGALTYHPHFGLQIVQARQTILAAGGAGVLWRETSNPSVATADGAGMAFRAGVSLGDMEMMQFHPTTLYVAGSTRSLISEAVRGEGATLLDRTGKRFMPDYHEQAELAPRDVVSRAILQQMAITGATHVYLDVRHLGAEAFARRFPEIDRRCRRFEINPARDLIPVHPAAHYMVGGARVDLDGRTNLPGLLACGEAACSGLHGANRLASNSLTEALVFGKRCGELAASAAEAAANHLAARSIEWRNPASERTELDLGDIRNSLRSVMWRNVGIIRCGERLAETQEIVGFWGRYVLDKEFYDPAGWEVQNMLTAAYMIVEAALRRTETRGVHFREDFPESDPIWARHQVLRRTPHQLVVEQA